MNQIYKILTTSFILFSLYTTNYSTAMDNNNGFHDSTQWVITPSLKYDMMCFLNILTGDTFYTQYYEEEYGKFKEMITPEAGYALKEIKRIIKDEGGMIVSAWLALYFSSSDAETAEELIEQLDDLPSLKNNFSKTVYHDEKSWERFESLKDHLRVVFKFLIDIKFPEYWKENVRPLMEEKAANTKHELEKYNVIKEVEQHLGFPLEDTTITVYVLNYCKPHGIKITGTRFITFGDYPFKISLRTATHEMMHPPYDLRKDSVLAKKLDLFREDEFVMDQVLNHDPVFGYNSFEGVMEEDCVQALDQVINTKFDAHVEPRFRWKQSDGGMHVFAVALYSTMVKENYNVRNEKFSEFLFRMIDEGKLIPGKIKEIYDEFYLGYVYEPK